MGIDAFDIHFRLEKTFNLTIDNEELHFVFDTVSTLNEFVWQKLHGVQPAIPLVGWRVSEYVLTNTLKLPGARKRFWQTFERMIPQQNRQANWERLSELLGCPLPPLFASPDSSILSFPKECTTPNELAVWITRHHPDRLPNFREARITPPTANTRNWTRDEVWHEIQTILVNTLMVEPSEIKPETRLIQDLGMD